MGLEGASWGQGSVWFTASEAGDLYRGQVWRYTPSKNLKHGTLELDLRVDRTAPSSISPTRSCVSPRGGVVLCEDGDGEDLDGGTNNLRVLTPTGKMETFADQQHAAGPAPMRRARRREVVGRSEWSGACFSPDGKWLFVHIQIPGITYAITGPWEKGWM